MIFFVSLAILIAAFYMSYNRDILSDLFGKLERGIDGLVYIPCKKIILLTLFLGWLGAHRFLVNNKISGFLYAFSFGFLGLGVAWDLALIASDSFHDRVGYPTIGEKKFCWFIVVMIVVIHLVLYVFLT